MGKKIDIFIAAVLPGALLWLYLSKRIENRAIAFAASLLFCIVFGKLMRKISAIIRKLAPVRKRSIRKNAGAALMRLASMPAERAEEEINSLIQKCYPGSDYPLEIVQQHPALKLSESAVFQAWKKHTDADQLVICASCKTDPVVRAFAAGFISPRISLIDSDMLSQMIAEYPEGLVTDRTPRTRMRLRHISNLLINRKNAPRNLLFSLSMLLMYIMTANILYLISALFLLTITFLSLRRKLRPNKLF